MKKILILAAILLCGCFPAQGKTGMSAKPEVTNLEIMGAYGTACPYDTPYVKDPSDPLCFTFTLGAGEKPTSIFLEVEWKRAGTENVIGRTDVETRVLKKGESERICVKLPENVSGRIEGFCMYGASAWENSN